MSLVTARPTAAAAKGADQFRDYVAVLQDGAGDCSSVENVFVRWGWLVLLSSQNN